MRALQRTADTAYEHCNAGDEIEYPWTGTTVEVFVNARGIRILVIALVVGGAVWTSCLVDRRSDGFECDSSHPCANGRVCSEGFCVVSGGGGGDAGVDANECPGACASCDFATTTCTIVGTGSGGIDCPDDWTCVIGCSTPGACGNISCTQATSCEINCDSTTACGNITCGSKSCVATCNGTTACGDISCSSGDCTATCTGSNACGTIDCSSGHCSATCSGLGACGDITCGSGPCDATCMGIGACGDISCTSSCRCDVACDPASGQCGTMTCPPAPAAKKCTTSGNAGDACFSGFNPTCSSC